ncbi:ABC transporter ATP-binding protein/permease [Desulfitobacterium chlororespirans]|uniref:ATP-binding cassette, subfamily B n=1 Tax=Desulfitobacterium chlororespirans DSM 11544 TaxID=1121395 RepID=A0A1M7UKP1_9FIRM|nr:ATP-binding cassette domain-containing protein [Desulfitobacterium chlororespirans]SHN83475.1 ATP-binding cassette, subfamily B [Desulfitobacterium chlororespirans DSM 11544]
MFINKNLIQFARGNGSLVAAASALELLVTLMGTGIAACLAFAIEMMIGARPLPFFSHIGQPFIVIAVLLMMRFVLVKQKTYLANQSSIGIKARLREGLMLKLFQLGPAYTAQKRTGDIANTISNKVEWLSNYYVMYLPTCISTAANAILILVVLQGLDRVTALICLLSCIGLFVCPMLFYSLTKERGEKEWQAHTVYYADCLDSIQGMVTLKAFNANRRRGEYIRAKGEELRRDIMSQLRITVLETGIMEFLVRFGGAFSIAVAVVQAAAGGGASAYLVYTLFLVSACFSPMMQLGSSWHMGYRGITASYSIHALLEEPVRLSLLPKVQAGSALKPESCGGDIVFHKVCFAYPKAEGEVLHDISFTVPQGTMMAIVGPSGSGKSTIASLLAGFYPVGSGRIQIGDKVLSEKNVAQIQGLISAVWQDSHLFYGSVLDNIRIGRDSATFEEVVAAAKKANIHHFIQELPKGYDTLLGEKGARFSGGERQRIAIARAFLKNAPILIFDEATSSLDRRNEIEIQQSFHELLQGKTALVIAHRMSTIMQAEQICVVEQGKIVDSGTHEELMEASAPYRLLMGSQMECQ